MNKAIKIAKRINKITKLNVFENTRRIEVVEVRSLLVFILYRYEKMKLHNIASFLEENGKSSDHSSVLHAFRMFEVYLKGNKKLGKLLTKLTKNTKDVNNQAKREFVKLKVNYLNNENIEAMVQLVDTMEQEELDEL